MTKIRLLRDFNQVGDERVPYIVDLSRVPCVGETIHTLGDGDPVDHGPSYYVVESVMHEANSPGLAARVGVTLHEFHKDLGPREPLPPEQRLGRRKKKID